MEELLKIKARSGLPPSFEDNMDGSKPGSFRFFPDTGQEATMDTPTISGLTVGVQNNWKTPNARTYCISGCLVDAAQASTMAEPCSCLTVNLQKNMEASKTWCSAFSKCLPDNQAAMMDTRRSAACTRQLSLSEKKTHPKTVLSCNLHCDPNEDVWAAFSDKQKSSLSRSVASISLRNGDRTLFSCSGIAINHKGKRVTRFLTSASLVRALIGNTTKDYMNLKIEVRHEGNKVHKGFLAEADLGHNFAVVDVHTFLDVPVSLKYVLEIPPDHDVLSVALGRDISGKLKTNTVKWSGNLSVSEGDIDLRTKISEAWEGGPLFSSAGNFLGMNLFLTRRKTFFVPWNIIFENLKQQSLAPREKLNVFRYGVGGETSNSHLAAYRNLNQEQLELDPMGYPQLPSTMLCDGLQLVNTFEEPFGDIYGVGVWSRLGEKVSSKLMQSVVALASYKGGKRFFACTGAFIEWNGSMVIVTSASLVRDSGDENKIVENLRIVVALPDDKRKEGKLLHYTLHYNVALVSVDYNNCHPANGLAHVDTVHVAAVGRCFESCELMAMRGICIIGSGTLDCKYLDYSTCIVTKAGIGGPLVTMDGDIIGMNFYDTKIGTPYLPWRVIYKILNAVEEKSKKGEAGEDIDSFFKLEGKAGKDINPFTFAYYKNSLHSMYDSKAAGEGVSCSKGSGADEKRLNRWPVPMPCWRHPDDVAKDKAACDYVDGIRCTYAGVEKVYLF